MQGSGSLRVGRAAATRVGQRASATPRAPAPAAEAAVAKAPKRPARALLGTRTLTTGMYSTRARTGAAPAHDAPRAPTCLGSRLCCGIRQTPRTPTRTPAPLIWGPSGLRLQGAVGATWCGDASWLGFVALSRCGRPRARAGVRARAQAAACGARAMRARVEVSAPQLAGCGSAPRCTHRSRCEDPKRSARPGRANGGGGCGGV